MNSFTNIKLAIGLGVGLAFILLAAWAFRVDHLRGEWKKQAENITSAVAIAANVRNLSPRDAPAVVAQLAANLRTCRENGARLEASVAGQNAAVDAFQRDGAARIAALDRATADARVAAQTARQRADAILTRRGTGNDCADAETAILEAIQ
jgi:hypothetical protein